MANIPAQNQGLIQEEETQFKAAVSEYTSRRMGSNMNFLLTYNKEPDKFKINGRYNTANNKPRLDGTIYFAANAEIIDISVYNGNAGTGGTTEINIYRYTTSGGTGTSIFTVTPKITSAAGNRVRFNIGSSVAGTTAPVMTSSSVLVNAGDWLECVCVSTMNGSPQDLEISVVWRIR